MSATFSPCGRYRYNLQRELPNQGELSGRVGFLMLNPSTADAEKNDPTIRRCLAFARAWGFAALEVGNLFAWRSTDPKVLPTLIDPVGPDNEWHLLAMADRCATIVCAWGVRGNLQGQADHVRELLRDFNLRTLRLTKGGHPEHPLYLPGSLKPERWSAA